MLFSVPQFIDVEDKVAGPLTWRQLLWMIGLGTILLVLYNTVPGTVFVVIAVPTILLFVALAFYRPYNRPLIYTLVNGVLFVFRPKIAVWERPTTLRTPKPVAPPPAAPAPHMKKVSREELRALAQTVDAHGRV